MKFNSRLLIMVVLLGFISVEINADWLDYQQFKGTAPGDTYLLNLKQGESLTFQVTYQLFIVDLYLFRLDSNTNSLVLVGGGFSQNNPQNFYYNVPTTGIYYLYTSDYSYPHQNRYKLVLETQTSKQIYYGNLMNLNSATSSTFYPINNAPPKSVHSLIVNSSCKVKILYNGPSLYKVHLFKPGVSIITGIPAISNTQDASQKQIIFTLPQAGNWKIVIEHNVLKIFQRTTYDISVKTDSQSKCSNGCNSGQFVSFLPGCIPSNQNSIQKFFPIDCSKVENNAGLVDGQCTCQGARSFNSLTWTCDFDCSKVENNAGLVDGQCTCQGARSFNSLTWTCDFDCSKVENNAGLVDGQCTCQGARSFNSLTWTCDLDCSKVVNSIGVALGYSHICLCRRGFIFYHDTYQCANPSRCNSQHKMNCMCQNGWFFDTAQLKCIIYCPIIPHASKNPEVTNQCQCDQGYKWSSLIQNCGPVCGDKIIVEKEQCDDGNLINKDGCSNICKIEKKAV